MRQYDVFINPSLRSRGERPYVVVLQHRLLSDLPRVLVAPMIRGVPLVAVPRVYPVVDFAGERLVIDLPAMAALDRRSLTGRVGDLDHQHDLIRPAIDLLFNGA